MRSAPAVFAVFFLGSNDDDDLRAKIKVDLHDAHRASSTRANPARTSPRTREERRRARSTRTSPLRRSIRRRRRRDALAPIRSIPPPLDRCDTVPTLGLPPRDRSSIPLRGDGVPAEGRVGDRARRRAPARDPHRADPRADPAAGARGVAARRRRQRPGRGSRRRRRAPGFVVARAASRAGALRRARRARVDDGAARGDRAGDTPHRGREAAPAGEAARVGEAARRQREEAREDDGGRGDGCGRGRGGCGRGRRR